MLPLGQLVEDPQEVDTAEAVSPAEGRGVADFQGLRGQLRLFPDDAGGKVKKSNAINKFFGVIHTKNFSLSKNDATWGNFRTISFQNTICAINLRHFMKN